VKPLPHQLTKSAEAFKVLQQQGIVYIAGKPRSGKTFTAILTLEKSKKINNVLVLTKKAAISGWEKFTVLSHINFTVTNYEQIKKVKGDFDACIIDESHNLGTVGKPSQRVKDIKGVCYDLPTILLSGTAIVESPNSIYHQCCISKYNPFSQFSTFYKFFSHYGIPSVIHLHGRQIAQYKKARPELLTKIDTFTVYMTQADAGITTEAEDVLHYVQLDPKTVALYKQLEKEDIITIKGRELVCDSTMKLRTSLHMMESGVAKIDDNYIDLGNREKYDYIRSNFTLDENTVILAHFIGEQRLLRDLFPKCTVESATSKAEGVSYAWAKEFILFSSGYSGSKYIQRRERIIDVQGSNTTKVHHIIVKGGISDQVQKAVRKKESFNNKTYKKGLL
jgi:hypothetical protein